MSLVLDRTRGWGVPGVTSADVVGWSMGGTARLRGASGSRGAAALPGQVHKTPAKICPGACVFPLLCIVLSPVILEPEIPISQALKTAGFVPDFASTTGHSIPDPDDPETRFTRKKRGSRPKNRVFFYTAEHYFSKQEAVSLARC